MTKRAGKKRFLKHQALISRLRVKRGLQGLLDEDRRATAVTPSLLPSAPVRESSTLVNYRALIPVDTNKIHYRACSHPLHPNDPRRLNQPQVFSLSLPGPLLPVALLPRSDPFKPITNPRLPVLVKQISVKQSRPRITARPVDPLILQATQRKATNPVPIRPPPQTTSGLGVAHVTRASLLTTRTVISRELTIEILYIEGTKLGASASGHVPGSLRARE